MVMAVGDPNKKWNLSHFIQNTPCVRTSLILGISTGLTGGLAAFLYTKHVKRSCDVAVGSFAVVSIGSWSVCSYRRYEQQKNLGMIVRALQKRDKERKENLKATDESKTDDENVELKQ